MGQKFIDQLKWQVAALSANDAGWMNVDTANLNAENRIENRQRLKLKPRLSATYVYEAEFTVYNVKGYDIVLGKRCIRYIH